MDRSHPQVILLASALSGMDDDALAALANKGLVRRARKDLEKAAPAIVDAGADFVSLAVEDATVRLAQPAAKSTCSCASGICRHILVSLIYLRESAPAAVPPPVPAAADVAAPTNAPQPAAAPADPAAALLAIDAAALQKWAGKPLLRRASVVLSRGYEIEQTPAAIIVKLPGQNITVRCLGGGLDAMLCACHAPGACEHKVAAVLAIQAHRTGRPLELSNAALQASDGAPRSREQVRASVAELLGEIIAMGLSRLSLATESRLRTLATSAHGVDLPRLSRMLKSLADEVTMTLKRDASASGASLLVSCSRVAALCDALATPTTALVGEHRSVYLPVAGSIEVAGLGAKRWRTRSGYHGLTVLFWEPSSRRWTAWNDARPLGTPGFDPVQRFEEGGPWAGAACPRQAASTFWRLSAVHRNAAGRITSRDNSRGISGRPSSPADGPLISDFSVLASIASTAFAPGLGDRPDHGDLVLLAPAQWAAAEYDPIRQEVSRSIADASGRQALLLLQHGPDTDQALTTLQQTDGTTVTAVLGSLRIGPQGLFVEPITLWTADKPIHLTLDGVPRQTTAAPAAAESDETADDDAEGETDDAVPLIEASPVGHLLMLLEDELVSIAESGIGVIRDVSALREAARELSSVGLAGGAIAITRLCDALDLYRNSAAQDPAPPARRLLQAAYIVHVAGVCQTVSLATRGR